MTPLNFDDFYNYFFETEYSIMEDVNDSHIMLEYLYPKIEVVLNTPIGDRKFKQLVGNFIDRNSVKLHKSGPCDMIPFTDTDQIAFMNLFKADKKEIIFKIKEVTKKISTSSDFKLLTQHPEYFIFYFCIRFYTLKKDVKGINTALAIYALSNYPYVFHTSFPHEPNEAVMQYTMDHLTEKYIMKQGKHVFGGLMLSIQHSYDFLKDYFPDAKDSEIIRFIQRIRNDQKSMIKNICDQYMKNHRAGNRIKLTKDSYDEVQIDDEYSNNTSQVEVVSNTIVNKILTNGLDLRRVTQCKDIAGIGMSDCRFYLSKIVTVQYTKEISAFVHAILFLYLYDERKHRDDINSSHFLLWSSELFRKTNSNNENIKLIKFTLDKWGEETGVHDKFKREASRVNYKKAIFWYFILSIQYYNK